MTSVAIAPPAVDEPVSPELALVDPELAARLRALLPVVELEPPPPLLRALPDPEPDDLPVAPPPELVAPPAPPALPVPAPVVEHVPVFVVPTRGDRIRSFAKAFAAGAFVATIVTVGVIAEISDGPAVEAPSAAPPRLAAPAVAGPAVKTDGDQPTANGSSSTGSARPPATTKPKVTPADSSTSGVGPRQSQPPAEPRRFAWAPVDGAVGYRLELFRDGRQVFEARVTRPAYQLASRWRHDGKPETLRDGEYRWYVWPVFSNGQSGAAVVQARLTVP